MADTLTEFAEHLAGKGLSDESIKVYLRYCRHLNKELEYKDLTQSLINKFILKHSSNATRSFLNNFFDFMDIRDFKVPKLTGRKAHKKRRSLSPQEIKVLRQWLYVNKNIRYLLCFDLSYTCALRRSEIFKMKVKDFDLKTWVEDPTKSCKLLIKGKGNKERFVPVKPKLMKRIIEYIGDQDKSFDDRLFAFDYKEWHNAFKGAVKSTLDYNFTLHDLRRSRATRWLQEGKDLIQVKNRLGHASVSTTQMYINLDEEAEFKKWAEE